jgi:hypothetical protein
MALSFCLFLMDYGCTFIVGQESPHVRLGLTINPFGQVFKLIRIRLAGN